MLIVTFINEETIMSPEFSAASSANHDPAEAERIIGIDKARFADRLPPEHEESWRKLVEFGTETGMTIEDIMVPVWQDESLPQAFRDRAMLLVVGTDEMRTAFGVEKGYSINMGLALGGLWLDQRGKTTPTFNPELFHTWTSQARAYQRDTGESLIYKGFYLRWQYEFYGLRLINNDELEHFLGEVDIQDVSPTWEGGGWGDDGRPLDAKRFPLLDDVLKMRTVSSGNKRTRAWALDTLDRWIDFQKDKTIEIPKWLQEVPPETGLSLYKGLINGGEKPKWLSWDRVHHAMELFGLDVFSNYRSELDLRTVNNVKNQSIQERLLKAILASAHEEAVSRDTYVPLSLVSYSTGSAGNLRADTIMRKVVDKTEDSELQALYEQEQAYVSRYKERRREQEEKSRVAYEESPEYRERQAKYAEFLGRVADLGARGESAS